MESNKSYLRGHLVEQKEDGQFYYCDTGDPTADTWKHRPFGHCGKGFTPEGHDGCLGTLPGVMNACCGHGQVQEAYVQFPLGITLRGIVAMLAIEKLKSENINTLEMEKPTYDINEVTRKMWKKDQERARMIFEKALRENARPTIRGEITPGKLRWRGIRLCIRHTQNGYTFRYLEQRGKQISPAVTMIGTTGGRLLENLSTTSLWKEGLTP